MSAQQLSWATRAALVVVVALLAVLATSLGPGAGVGAVRFQNGGRQVDNRGGSVGSDTQAGGRDWSHGRRGGGTHDLDLERPGVSSETDRVLLLPIGGCPPRCRCYHAAYRGAGLPEPGRLVTVNCSRLGLFDFPDALPVNTQVLDMSSNSVRNLSGLPRLAELLVLDVSRNFLRYLDNRWLFEHVTQLTVLNLSHNGLRSLLHGSFLGLTSLLELDLSGNRLQRADLHAFTDLSSLKVFSLEGNGLFHVRRAWFKSMPSLVELRLGDNSLATVEAGSLPLPRLQHLDLSSNRFRRIDPGLLTGLANLRLVNLSNNRHLGEVPGEALRAAPGLDILLLDGLGLATLTTHAVSGLTAVELSLSYTSELRAVGPAAFHNLSRLQTLLLHDCPRLAYLHPDAFSGLPQLRRLFIHNNALMAVSQRVVASLPRLGDLHLYHNPFRCDCNVYWLRKQLSEYSRRHYSHLGQGEPASAQSSGSDTGRVVSSPSPTSIINNHSTIFTSITTSTGSSSSSNKNITIRYSTIISDPGRVSCFFPDGASSLPLVQQPLQYFPQSCAPLALTFFPPVVNVSLGEPLDLECEGLGVPQPSVSWVLPHGQELNATSAHAMRTREAAAAAAGSTGGPGGRPSAYLLHQPSGSEPTTSLTTGPHFGDSDSEQKPRAVVLAGNTLHIPKARLLDSGSYVCRVSSALGHDLKTVTVHVQPKPLTFTAVTVSNEYVTVAWRGSIPRAQMQQFQLFYRKLPSESPVDVSGEERVTGRGLDDGTRPGPKVSSQTARLDLAEHREEFSVLALGTSTHTFTIDGLEPQTRYELCLVYRREHAVQCQLLTTTARDVARVMRAGAGVSVRVSKAQVGAGIGLTVGALVAVWAGLVARRFRRRGRKSYQGYMDPLREEKASIPLEGLGSTAGSTPGGSAAPCTPLTSSRTALLAHSHV